MTIAAHAPQIDTADLILRGYAEEDFEPLAAFNASPRAAFVGGPLGRADSWRAYLAGIGHWVRHGFGMWVIQHRASGEPIGRAGVIFHDGWHAPELGWQLWSDRFEGRGLAHQACLAARAHAARHFGLCRLISYLDPANTRSLALARRLGARFEQDTVLLGKPCQIYRHPTPEGLS